MESLSWVTLLLIFVSITIAFPVIGLVCGTLMSIVCEFIHKMTIFLFNGFIGNKYYQTAIVKNQNNSTVEYAAYTGMRFFYLLGTSAALLMLLISLLFAGLAYFGPLVVGIGLFWTYSPVAEPTLVAATGIFILTYVATMIVAIFRTTD